MQADDTEKSQNTGTNVIYVLCVLLLLIPDSMSQPLFFCCCFSSASKAISRKCWQSDVCALAGSHVCRKETGCGRSSPGVSQNLTQKRRLARPVTRKVH